MPSTIVENTKSLTPRFEDEGSLVIGLNVLRDLIGHVRLPQDHHHEFLALLSLESLLANRPCSDTVAGYRDDLLREVQLLQRDDIISLVHWICPPRWTMHQFRPWRKSRCRRHLHLLVLLARVIAPVSRYVVIPVLAELGLCPDRAGCYCILNWVPRFCGRDGLRLARRYLELTCKVWFDETSRNINRHVWDRVTEFSAWPWQRQILELLAWRIAWDAEQTNSPAGQSNNPALVSDTIEFCLAREQKFKRIRRAGGRLATLVIDELGYHDLSYTRSRGRVILVGFAFLFMTLSAALSIDGIHRADAWNRSNDRLTAEIREKIKAAVVWLAHSDASAAGKLDTFFTPRYNDFQVRKIDSLGGK
jgi:hypothetical protein